MAPDDLNTPLGQIKSKRLPNIPGTAPQWLAGVLGLSGLVVVGWAVFVKDPLGGEPVAVVATEQTATKQTARDSDKDGKAARTPRRPVHWRARGRRSRALAAARIADGHHHRWLERRAAAGHHSRQCARRQARCSIPSCLRPRAMAQFRKSDRTARARRRVTRIRARSRRTRKTCPSLPSSSAGLASAPPAPPMHSQNFPQR